MTNEETIKKIIKRWQKVFGLEKWTISFKFVDFSRTDFIQSGDVKVDLKKKTATILISNNPQLPYEKIVVHELVHLVLWEFDHFAESMVKPSDKNKYFDLLENTVAQITESLLISR